MPSDFGARVTCTASISCSFVLIPFSFMILMSHASTSLFSACTCQSQSRLLLWDGCRVLDGRGPPTTLFFFSATCVREGQGEGEGEGKWRRRREGNMHLFCAIRGCISKNVLAAHICAQLHESLANVQVSLERCKVQSRVPPHIPRIHLFRVWGSGCKVQSRVPPPHIPRIRLLCFRGWLRRVRARPKSVGMAGNGWWAGRGMKDQRAAQH
jgi:hypothetical protein